MLYWATKKKPTREEERSKQINQLKHSFPSVRRPNNDDELFEVRFVADGQYSSLRVFITSDFPDTAPVIQAQGPVQHPWLDSQRVVVGSAKLRNWSSKSTLSEVVEECVQALMAGTNTVIAKSPAVDSYGRPLSSSLPVAQSLSTAHTASAAATTAAPAPAQTHTHAQAQLYRNPYAPVTAVPAALPMATATPAATTAAQPATHSYPVIANVVPNPPRTSLPYTPSPAAAAAPAPLPYGYNYGGAVAVGASPYSQYSYPALAAVPAAAPAVPAAAPAASSAAVPPAVPAAAVPPAVPAAAVPPAVPPRAPAAVPAPARPETAYNAYSAQLTPGLSAYPAIPAATANPVSAVSAYSAVPAASSAYSAVPAPAASSYSAVPAVSSAYSTAAVYSAVPAATSASPIAAVPAVGASNKSQPSSSQKQAQQSAQDDSDEDEGLGAFVMPDIPVHCAELDSMTDAQLQRLINDDVALKALANKQESILSTMSLKDDLRSANLEKATRNVAMADEIMAMQRKAQDLQAQLKAAYQEYQTEVGVANQEFGFNAEEALRELDKFKESLDSKSEDIGSKFVQGEMDVNAFLKEYLEVRTKYHDVNDRILLVSKPM